MKTRAERLDYAARLTTVLREAESMPLTITELDRLDMELLAELSLDELREVADAYSAEWQEQQDALRADWGIEEHGNAYVLVPGWGGSDG